MQEPMKQLQELLEKRTDTTEFISVECASIIFQEEGGFDEDVYRL
jgi:hypothetical protein